MPGASLGVVAFGLLASLCWGASDYGGGLTSRRASLYGVLLFTQVVGLSVAAGLALATDEAIPSGTDLAISAVCGLLGTAGLAFLYGGLSAGRMGVVAPVAGVLAAMVPVVGGIALQGLPGTIVLVGIVLAIVAVVLVSIPTDADGGRPSGLPYAIAAGVTMGAFSFLISRVSIGQLFWPLVVVRTVEAVGFLAIILVARRRWRVGRGHWPYVVGIGVLDVLGNASYLTATHLGALAVAAVTSSLYPVVTVILATILLRERVTGAHAIGVFAATVAIALIAAGSAG